MHAPALSALMTRRIPHMCHMTWVSTQFWQTRANTTQKHYNSNSSNRRHHHSHHVYTRVSVHPHPNTLMNCSESCTLIMWSGRMGHMTQSCILLGAALCLICQTVLHFIMGVGGPRLTTTMNLHRIILIQTNNWIEKVYHILMVAFVGLKEEHTRIHCGSYKIIFYVYKTFTVSWQPIMSH
jgi:hypothetical protein